MLLRFLVEGLLRISNSNKVPISETLKFKVPSLGAHLHEFNISKVPSSGACAHDT